MNETIPLRLIGVGPQRTGSTWLDAQLRRHPALALPAHVKETFFFDRRWARGLDEYRRHFPPEASGGEMWAEVAPTYFDAPDVPARIVSVAPEVRAVITLRDPVERAVSLYLHHRAKGRVGEDFWEASGAIPSIVGAGDYAEHIPRWLEVMGRENVHVVLLQDIAESPEAVLSALTSWAGLTPLAPAPEAEMRMNATRAPRFPALAQLAARAVSMLHRARLHRVVAVGKRVGLHRVYDGADVPDVPDTVRQRLSERYAPHVAYVEAILERETGWA